MLLMTENKWIQKGEWLNLYKDLIFEFLPKHRYEYIKVTINNKY